MSPLSLTVSNLLLQKSLMAVCFLPRSLTFKFATEVGYRPPWLQDAFNITSHEMTGMTLFENILPFRGNTPLTSRLKIQDLLAEKSFPFNILRSWEKVRTNLIQKNRRRMEVRYNPYRNPSPFKVTDLVWLRSHHVCCAGEGISAKILPRWEEVCLKLTPLLRPLRLCWFILSPDLMYRELISRS
jgi:hypothetical protein